MNTFIILGCVPVPEWQHKIDFVTKTVLDKENTYILVRKKKIYTPPQRTPLGVLGVKKVAGESLLYHTPFLSPINIM